MALIHVEDLQRRPPLTGWAPFALGFRPFFLLGAIQGVFLAGVLVTKRTNRTANRLLAALMLAFSISLTTMSSRRPRPFASRYSACCRSSRAGIGGTKG